MNTSNKMHVLSLISHMVESMKELNLLFSKQDEELYNLLRPSDQTIESFTEILVISQDWVAQLKESIIPIGAPDHIITTADVQNAFLKGMEAATFTLDGEHTYKGLHNAVVKWNGWAVPYFDKETAIRILKENEIEYFFLNETIIMPDENGAEPCSPTTIIMPDGNGAEPCSPTDQGLYCIGGWEWTWAVASTPIVRERDTYNPDGL